MGHALSELYLKPGVEERDFPAPAGGRPAGDSRWSWAKETEGVSAGATKPPGGEGDQSSAEGGA